MNNPTPEQEAHATLAHHEIVETVNRLITEGMDCRVVLAGIGAAAADLITTKYGNQAVAPWFEKQAEMIDRVVRGPG